MEPQPVDIVLRDGSTVLVRAVRPGDERGLVAFHEGLSDESRYFRFFSLGVDLGRVAREAASVRPGMTTLVAERGVEGRIVAVAQLARLDSSSAEIAFASADDLAGLGLATSLLAHLAQLARSQGLSLLRATVLDENFRMARVFRHSGFPFKAHHTDDGLVFEAPAELSPEAIAAFEERMSGAVAASVARALQPASVAVAGSAALLERVVGAGFAGPVTPLAEASGPVDLVVADVPAAASLDVARDAAALGAGALVMLSEGFAELGPQGLERQRALLEVCRRGGMRLIGPNCLGALNTAVGLNATGGADVPTAGRVAMMTQSGALGLALLERSSELGIGVSSFLSAGNKADLSGNDFLQFCEHDDATRVVVLHLESFGNPRNFARIARRVAARKPVIAVKSGRTPAGARVVESHTGALLAAADVTVDALFRQTGVLRTGTVADLLSTAALLSRAPVPRGSRVAIVANAGGPAVLCADACVASGLDVVSAAALRAPVSASAFADAVTRIAEEGSADAVIAIASRVPGAGAALAGAAAGLPVLLVTLTRDVDPVLPTYRFPEDAARALGRAAQYGAWLREPRENAVVPEGIRATAAAALLAEAAGSKPAWLAPADAAQVCADYGIAVAASSSEGSRVDVGMTLDPFFGPVVAVRAPGARREDLVVRLTPITLREAADIARSLRLDGVDVAALADVVVRVSALADAHPEIVEIDLSPVAVLARGAVAVDPRIRVAAPEAEPMWPAVGVAPPRR